MGEASSVFVTRTMGGEARSMFPDNWNFLVKPLFFEWYGNKIITIEKFLQLFII